MFSRLLLIIPIFLGFISIKAQPSIQYSIKKEVYNVYPENNTFEKSVNISGICKANIKNDINIYFGELETIHDVSARYQTNNKWRKVSKKDHFSQSVLTSAFYSGFKSTTIPIPSQKKEYPFEYEYHSVNEELLFLSKLDFSNLEFVDKYEYQITLPKTHELHFEMSETLKKSGLIEFSKREEGTQTIYNFNSSSKKDTIYPEGNDRYVRLIVVPLDEIPYNFYNDWYYDLVEPMTLLNDEIKNVIREQVKGLVGKERIGKAFDLIKDRTSYIDIENGLGAVKPRDVNKIWHAQQGDCKDMSNLLCQALISLGFEAYVALSSTIGHSFNLDFPSLSSANHAICVVKFKDEWIYLDATERSGFFGYPSRQIQGRNIFIIDNHDGELVTVPKVSAKDNIIEHSLRFHKIRNSLKGEINSIYHGLSQIDFRDAKKWFTDKKFESWLQNYLEERSSNLSCEKSELVCIEDHCEINAVVSSERNFTNLKNKTYLSLAFLGMPSQMNIELNENELKFYQSCSEKFNVELLFDTPIVLQYFDSVSLIEGAISFEFSIKQTGPKTVNIVYHYRNELLRISGLNLELFKTINRSIKETLRKSIIYEEQS